MAGGKVQGQPLRIQDDFGKDPLRIIGVGGGAFYYSILTGASDIYTVSMARATGKVTSSPIFVPTPRNGAVLPRWSPDSQRLLYETASPVGATAWSTRELWIYSFAADKNQRVASGVPLATGGSCWSRDAQTLLFNRGADQERIESVRFNLSKGQAEPMNWSPDTIGPGLRSGISRTVPKNRSTHSHEPMALLLFAFPFCRTTDVPSP
jgi:hypothetical protein